MIDYNHYFDPDPEPFRIALIKCKRGKSPKIIDFPAYDRVSLLTKRITSDQLGFVNPPFQKR